MCSGRAVRREPVRRIDRTLSDLTAQMVRAFETLKPVAAADRGSDGLLSFNNRGSLEVSGRVHAPYGSSSVTPGKTSKRSVTLLTSGTAAASRSAG